MRKMLLLSGLGLIFFNVLLASQGPERPDRISSVAAAPSAPANMSFFQKFVAHHPSFFLFRMFGYQPDVQSLVLCNAAELLKKAYATKQQFCERGMSLKIDDLVEVDIARGVQEHKKLLKLWEEQCPFVLLGECTKVDFWPCSLSRLENPRYRQLYEDRLVDALCKKIDQSQGRAVQYVSFASGGLFQDVVVLTKLFAQRPEARLAVHFIDFQFTPYVAACELRDGMHTIDATHDLDLNAIMVPLTELACREWGGGELSEHQLEKMIYMQCTQVETKIKEVVAWLKITFPHVQVTFYVHNTSQGYTRYVVQKNIAAADVITAVDIQDEMSLLRSSVLHYRQLYLFTSSRNPQAYSLWLDKSWIEHDGHLFSSSKDVELRTWSMTQGPASKEIKLTKDDGSEVCIYEVAEKL